MFKMATHRVTRPERPDRCTDFQLHLEGHASNVIDFTERKLVRYALATQDEQQRIVLMALIVDYRAGAVAVAWRQGRPIPLRVAATV